MPPTTLNSEEPNKRYNARTSHNVHVMVEVTAKGIALFIGNSTLTILFLLLL